MYVYTHIFICVYIWGTVFYKENNKKGERKESNESSMTCKARLFGGHAVVCGHQVLVLSSLQSIPSAEHHIYSLNGQKFL